MKVGILGGGLAGLSVAAHLEQECEVLEKEGRCGGHCRSVQEQGFTFDAGGPHIIFSHNQRMVDYIVSLLQDNVRRGRRSNKIFYKGRYVKYPFENGLFDLDPQDRYECLYYYLRNDSPAPTNFKEWLYHTFGKGITEKYLLPYNEKIWNLPADQMALDWVEGRVPKPPLEDVIKSAVGVETEGYTHQLYFHYPIVGGIESLPKALEKRVRNITTDFTVDRISREGRSWIVGNGLEERRYDRLVATIPIQDLVSVVDGVPMNVVSAVRDLRYNSLITIAVGLCRAELPEYTAVYVPDPQVKFHRLSFPSVFSPCNAPDGKAIIVAEITANEGDGTWEMDDDALIRAVIADLDSMGMMRPEDVCYTRVARSKYGYVVRDFNCGKNVKVARSYFEGIGIDLCGRVAEFEYLNMDVCVERGMSLALRLNQGG